MHFRKLGRWGVKVSVVGLGSWLTYGGSGDRDAARARIRRNTPLEETCSVMNDRVRSGAVRYWGVSEWNADRIAAAFARMEAILQPVALREPYPA